jgi:predicted DNA-binding transcriptional regulator AlpA
MIKEVRFIQRNLEPKPCAIPASNSPKFTFFIGVLLMQTLKVRWLRASAASNYLGLSKSTLAKQRMSGSGPRFSKVGQRAVVYDLTDLDSYLESRKVINTEEESRNE